jgi:hypothetical protein
MWTHQQESIEYGNVVHEIIFVKQKKTLILVKSISEVDYFNQKKVVRQTIQDIVNHTALDLF